MAREIKYWFEFAGVSSADYGISVITAPVYKTGKRRGKQTSVSGRDGYIWTGDSSDEETEISLEMLVPTAQYRAVLSWLRGSGDFRTSDKPNRLYKAQIIKSYSLEPNFHMNWHKVKLTLTLQPFPRILPAAATIELKHPNVWAGYGMPVFKGNRYYIGGEYAAVKIIRTVTNSESGYNLETEYEDITDQVQANGGIWRKETDTEEALALYDDDGELVSAEDGYVAHLGATSEEAGSVGTARIPVKSGAVLRLNKYGTITCSTGKRYAFGQCHDSDSYKFKPYFGTNANAWLIDYASEAASNWYPMLHTYNGVEYPTFVAKNSSLKFAEGTTGFTASFATSASGDVTPLNKTDGCVHVGNTDGYVAIEGWSDDDSVLWTNVTTGATATDAYIPCQAGRKYKLYGVSRYGFGGSTSVAPDEWNSLTQYKGTYPVTEVIAPSDGRLHVTGDGVRHAMIEIFYMEGEVSGSGTELKLMLSAGATIKRKGGGNGVTMTEKRLKYGRQLLVETPDVVGTGRGVRMTQFFLDEIETDMPLYLSFEAKITDASYGYRFNIWWRDSNNVRLYVMSPTITLTDEYVKYSFPVDTSDLTDVTSILLNRSGSWDEDNPNYTYLKNLKLEYGVCATPFSAAPETESGYSPYNDQDIPFILDDGDSWTPGADDTGRVLECEDIDGTLRMEKPLTQTINNPGTAYSRPYITVEGAGDVSLTVGEQTTTIKDVPEGGILLDCEMLDAMNPERTKLLNSHVDTGDDGFIRIEPGESDVTVESENGVCLGVEIEPRWRDI